MNFLIIIDQVLVPQVMAKRKRLEEEEKRREADTVEARLKKRLAF